MKKRILKMCLPFGAAAVLLVTYGNSASSATNASARTGSVQGTPVKLLVMYQFAGDPVAQHPEVGAGAQAAAKAINSQGGINGHPIQIITCDIHDTATGEQACAEKAVSDGATAVVGLLFESGCNRFLPSRRQESPSWVHSGCTRPLSSRTRTCGRSWVEQPPPIQPSRTCWPDTV